MQRHETIARWWLTLGLLASVPACQKEPEQAPTEQQQDAGAVDKTAQIDPSLAKAVEAAKGKAPTQADAASGPPPNGIFGPGGADKEMPVGAPPKITLGGQGEAPRYTLSGATLKPRDKMKGTIQMAVQTDPRQGALPVDFSLSFEGKPPVAEPGAAATALTHVVATVEAASVGAVDLPAAVTDELKKLKGSRIEYELAANGAGSNFTPMLTKQAAGSELTNVFNALGDALATLTLPMPDQPVGTGAFWMATTRERVMGLDTVTYRLIRVERAEPTQMTFTLETKRYAASADFSLVPGNWTLVEFQSAADGTAMLAHGQPFPFKALLKLNVIAGVTNKDKPAEQGSVVVQGQARVNFADLEDPAGKTVSVAPAAAGAAAPAAARPTAPPAPASPAPGPAPAAP
ncbi:MAG TPA: hypothetical protein VI197_00505 [Polyangiaceae bacterium]